MFATTVQGQEMMEQLRLKRDELEQAVHNLLKPEIDYLVMDERRLCLLKPGAEKLCDYFGYTVQYELVQSSASHVTEQAMYIVKAVLSDWQTGAKISEGLGLASSQESRYDGQSSMDVANTILRTSKERALIDAVISAIGGSFLFTQDQVKSNYSGDFQQNQSGSYPAKEQNNRNQYQQNGYGKSGSRNYGNQNKGGKNGYGTKSGYKNSSNGGAITESQVSYIENLVSKLRINRQQLAQNCRTDFR